MAKKKSKINETLNVENLTEPIKEAGDLTKENYLNGLEFAVSLWEANVKALNAQVDYMLDFEEEYVNSMNEVSELVPTNLLPYVKGNSSSIKEGADMAVAFQRDYIKSVREVSENFKQDTLDTAQKNVEKAISVFDDFVKVFRV